MSSLAPSSGYNSTQFKINAQDKSFGQPMQAPSEIITDSQIAADGVGGVRVGRRFGRTSKENPSNRLVDRERTTSRFGRLHQRKMSRLQLQEQVRKGERHAKIALTRSYRAGDLPDIKISAADLVKCLRNLCYRDSQIAVSVARMILAGIFYANV